LAESPGPATTGERGAAVTPPDSLAARSVGSTGTPVRGD
jgi:hypothetical protein